VVDAASNRLLRRRTARAHAASGCIAPRLPATTLGPAADRMRPRMCETTEEPVARGVRKAP
jgi:hypothetical protein